MGKECVKILTSSAQEQDWHFAYERSEMLREFQTGLLISIGHELRSPLSSQIGSLQMILCDLCDTPEEEREYLETSKRSVEQLVHLLEEFSHLVRYPLPIQPISPTQLDLLALLRDVHQLTRLQAQDRGLRYLWPDLQASAAIMTLHGDPVGFSQALLGLCWWGITHLQHGSVQVGEVLGTSEGREATWHAFGIDGDGWFYLPITLSGHLADPIDPREHRHWGVCSRLLAEMGAQVQTVTCRPDLVRMEIQIQTPSRDPVSGESSPDPATE